MTLERLVLNGDSRELLKTFDAESFDAVVCDPPYELGFMGRAWDSSGIAFDPTLWREVARVLKPGGFLLAFGGSRTYHRIAVAIEDAGFEIRDSISWLFGQGFPKSLDVSKAIEKRREDEPEVRIVCRFLRAAIDAHPRYTVRDIAAAFEFHPRMVEHWAARDTDSQPTLPTDVQWDALRAMLAPYLADNVDALVRTLNARKGEYGEDYHAREHTGTLPPDKTERVTYAITGRDKIRRDIAATPLAAAWDGWGTALKPAWEPIIVARKPLEGTVAENVLAHGVGGINVNACRIPSNDLPDEITRNVSLGSSAGSIYGKGANVENFARHDGGRWPANVILDEEAAAMLDAQTGDLGKSSGGRIGKRDSDSDAVYSDGLTSSEKGNPGFGDSGGASRFFYVAKANRAERDAGLLALAGSDVRNPHPTVKPIALMRYLCRLVTPKGGRVLDPFAGSGSTGCAAALEGFAFVGFDLLPEHSEIAARRIDYWARVAQEAPLDLFAGYNPTQARDDG